MAKDDYFVIAYRIMAYLYACLKVGEQPDFNNIRADALDISQNYWEYIIRHLFPENDQNINHQSEMAWWYFYIQKQEEQNMNRTIKTVYFHDGQLFAELDSRRVKLYDCKASVDIQEHVISIPVIGRGKVIDRRNVVLLITFEHAAQIEMNADLLSRISGFSFQGSVLLENGSYRQIHFNRCLLEDDLDITESGSCRFEVKCSQELLNELRQI